jgi:hypothetical protein
MRICFREAVVPYPQGQVRCLGDWRGVRRQLLSPPVSRTASYAFDSANDPDSA